MEERKLFTIVLVVGWTIATYLMSLPFKCGDTTEVEPAELQKKLKLISLQVKRLQQHNPQVNLLYEFGPSEEYESLRRRIYCNTKKLWQYIGQLSVKSPNKDLRPDQIRIFLREVLKTKRLLLSDHEKLPSLDGYEAWRRQEAASVGDLVQRRLHHLQHPQHCQTARKLKCGFGCQLHHIAYCLIVAYATERTLILTNKEWRYSNSWVDTFYPLSDTCNSTYDDKVWTFSVTQEAKVVSLPVLYFLSPKPNFIPLAIPEDLADRIIRFNGDPSSWWIAQMIKYILKPRTHIQKLINDTIANMDLKPPVVGVHIRRTDKVDTEAEYHGIDEYMSHVDDYYAQLELTRAVDQRRVYLATDDAQLLEDARQKFPRYKFYGDSYRAKTAATHQRYKPPALTNLLIDLHLLAMSDYLVCTLSSQFCLLAFEMMQSNRVDASNSFYSLDDQYHFVGQNPHSRIIVQNDNHALQVGSDINTSGLWTDIYSGGKISKKGGVIPWYKTADVVEVFPFPEYKQVPLFN